MLEALRAVLRDDRAHFRTPEQEEAVRLAAAKETPLVAVLPTGGGKSLVFMVPAMLAGAGVTVVVAPYAELKRQLVSRCVDAGLDCKHWPEARDSWPRVTLVSAEAAVSDDFLQWAADLSVQGRLDRVVVDECHLTFTAADEYRGKLRGWCYSGTWAARSCFSPGRCRRYASESSRKRCSSRTRYTSAHLATGAT